jgi:hypothetical protein
MAGFARISSVGEYFNQEVVNVYWYRSTEWFPNQGNPFTDTTGFVNQVRAQYEAALLAYLPTDFTMKEWSGIGYDDSLGIVTSSPVVVASNQHGGYSTATDGAAQAANLSFVLGPQHAINGVGLSKRNRGYLSIGPISSEFIDNYSHLGATAQGWLDDLGQLCMETITVVNPAVNLIPIRVHQAYMLGVKSGRSYSDILGYRLPRVATYRRSRQPEA